MFQLLKIRTFADYISDVFQFLKLYGMHYLKNYIKFSFVGIFFLIIAVSVFSFFYSRILPASQFFSEKQLINNNFVSENTVLTSTCIIAFALAILVLIVLNYSYPVYYLQLINKQTNEKPQLSSIRALFKKDLRRLLIFGLVGVIFSAFVIAISLIMVALFLITFIGFIYNPFAFFIFLFVYFLVFAVLIPFFTIWFTLTFFYYSNDSLSFFTATRKALTTIFKKFWTIMGTAFCMMIIVNVSASVITKFPFYIIMMFGFLFGISDINTIDNMQVFHSSTPIAVTIIMIIIYCISTLISMVLSHLILIQIGLFYYSERTKAEQTNNSLN